MSKTSREELSTICTLLWAAWCCRNKHIFENEQVQATVLAGNFLKMVRDYKEYTVKVLMPSDNGCPSPSHWSVPPVCLVKANFDAHIAQGGEVGMGVVIRDEDGRVLCLRVKRVAARWDATMAEAMAARYAIELAYRFGFMHLVLEGDALAVVRAVELKQIGSAPLFQIYDDIAHWRSEFVHFSVSHVKRAGNVVAHLLARWRCLCNSELVWLDNFPQSVTTLVELDLI